MPRLRFNLYKLKPSDPMIDCYYYDDPFDQNILSKLKNDTNILFSRLSNKFKDFKAGIYIVPIDTHTKISEEYGFSHIKISTTSYILKNMLKHLFLNLLRNNEKIIDIRDKYGTISFCINDKRFQNIIYKSELLDIYPECRVRIEYLEDNLYLLLYVSRRLLWKLDVPRLIKKNIYNELLSMPIIYKTTKEYGYIIKINENIMIKTNDGKTKPIKNNDCNLELDHRYRKVIILLINKGLIDKNNLEKQVGYDEMDNYITFINEIVCPLNLSTVTYSLDIEQYSINVADE
ncbi:MAG: hypothetical protein QXO37_08510 [Candidatus Nitrosocaldaceae archaeon]